MKSKPKITKHESFQASNGIGFPTEVEALAEEARLHLGPFPVSEGDNFRKAAIQNAEYLEAVFARIAILQKQKGASV